MSKEIEYDNVLTKLLDNEQISQDDVDKITVYIDSLKDEISDLESECDELEYERDELEGEVSRLEDEIEEEKTYQNQEFRDRIQEIVDDQWKYVTVTYNTKEKIIDRLDYILRYY